MNPVEKEFRKKLIQILLQAGNTIEANTDQVVWKIAGLLKFYRNTTFTDVWVGNKDLKTKIEVLLKDYSGRITAMTQRQIREIWTLTEIKNDMIIKNHIAGIADVKVSTSKLYKWFNRILPFHIDPKAKITISESEIDKILKSPRNESALNAFLERQVNGIKLSARVWKISDTQFKPLIESYLADGIDKAKSAGEISREVRMYLEEPNKLFRRVRNKEHGNLQLSTKARAYHPGQGVYRSSYKNAIRLTRNEINEAFRTSDHTRWSAMEFITGIEVELSEQHPVTDICDTMQGEYPSDFHFPGWHVQCLCHASPVLMPKDKFKKYLAGDKVEVMQISETPQVFNDWLNNNEERINGWSSKPYFMQYNQKYVDHALNKKLIKT
jgi:hypothetical protein